jgi:hypothetical protein
MRLEQQAHARDRERQERREERKQMKAPPTLNPTLTREEQEARILAFMYAVRPLIPVSLLAYQLISFNRNYKPTDSDLEDDDSSDDDDDPGTWFDNEDEDGIKGQNIVLPDTEDYTNIIRIDEGRIPYNIFYEPRDDQS